MQTRQIFATSLNVLFCCERELELGVRCMDVAPVAFRIRQESFDVEGQGQFDESRALDNDRLAAAEVDGAVGRAVGGCPRPKPHKNGARSSCEPLEAALEVDGGSSRLIIVGKTKMADGCQVKRFVLVVSDGRE